MSQPAKRIKLNTEWDWYEEWFNDEYLLYMYFVIDLGMISSMMSAFSYIWQSKMSLYTTVEQELWKNGWTRICDDATPWYFRGFKDDRIINMSLDDDLLTIYCDVQTTREATFFHWSNRLVIVNRVSRRKVTMYTFLHDLMEEIV